MSVRALVAALLLGTSLPVAAEPPAPESQSPTTTPVVTSEAPVVEAPTVEVPKVEEPPLVVPPPAEPTTPDVPEPPVPPAPPAPVVERFPLTIVLASDLDGALADAECGPVRSSHRTLAHLAASSRMALESALSDGRTVAATLYLGDFTGPAALTRWLLERPGGVDRFTSLVARAGFRTLTLGNHWYDQRPELLDQLARRLPALGVQPLVGNVACQNRADCAALSDLPRSLRLPVRGLDVRLGAVALESVLAPIDASVKKGLTIQPSAAAATALASELRADGADVVVLATHVASTTPGTAPLGHLIADSSGADLVVANRLEEVSGAAATLETEHGPALAVAGDQRTTVLRVDFDVVVTRDGDRRRVRIEALRALRLAAEEPELALADDLASLSSEFCADWDRPLPNPAHATVPENVFRDWTLDAVRRAAESDVSVVNAGLIDDAPFPLPEQLSTADVFRAIAWDDVVVRVDVPGSKLRELWGRRREGERSRKRLHFAGILEREGKVFVNGRPLDDTARYRVGLTRFVSDGGDELVGKPLEAEDVLRDGKPVRVREEVLLGLARVGGGLDLFSMPRWTWTGALTLSASDTHVANTVSNPDPRLGKPVATAARGEFTGRTDLDAADHNGRLIARVRYAASTVAGAPISETEDQAYFEGQYRLKALRRLAGDNPWVPYVYASSFLDSELVPTPDKYRHAELAGTGGLRFAPFTPFELKVGASLRRELFQPEARLRLGVEFGYELPRFTVVRWNGLPVDVESNLDWFIGDIGGANLQETRFRGRLMLPLGGVLSATVGADVLLLRRGGEDLAILSDLTFGITARLDGARQFF